MFPPPPPTSPPGRPVLRQRVCPSLSDLRPPSPPLLRGARGGDGEPGDAGPPREAQAPAPAPRALPVPAAGVAARNTHQVGVTPPPPPPPPQGWVPPPPPPPQYGPSNECVALSVFWFKVFTLKINRRTIYLFLAGALSSTFSLFLSPQYSVKYYHNESTKIMCSLI